MIKHYPDVDYDFPFVKGSHSLLEKQFGTSVDDLKLLCQELTNGYMLPVEPIGEIKGEVGTYYLRVPESLSEVQIGWLHEIIKYHIPAGVLCIIVQSDEHPKLLFNVLTVEYDIHNKIKLKLTRASGKITNTNKGIGYIKMVVEDVLKEYEYDVNNIIVTSTSPSAVDEIQVNTES